MTKEDKDYVEQYFGLRLKNYSLRQQKLFHLILKHREGWIDMDDLDKSFEKIYKRKQL
jgi:hypothetical protein